MSCRHNSHLSANCFHSFQFGVALNTNRASDAGSVQECWRRGLMDAHLHLYWTLLDFIGHLRHNGDAGLHQTHIDVYFYHRLCGGRISSAFLHSWDILEALTMFFTFIKFSFGWSVGSFRSFWGFYLFLIRISCTWQNRCSVVWGRGRYGGS